MHRRLHPSGGVEILGVPLDLGANLRGANIAPATVRIAGLAEKLAGIGIRAVDGGDIPVPLRETLSASAAEERYLSIIAETCEELCQRVEQSLARGRFPLVIG